MVAGIQKPNFSNRMKPSSMKMTAANAMSTQPAATGNVSRSAKTPCTSYGVMAQRSKAGTGTIFNQRQFLGGMVADFRASANASRIPTFNNIGDFFNNPVIGGPQKTNNKFANAMATMGMINELAKTGVGLYDQIQASKNSGKNGVEKMTGEDKKQTESKATTNLVSSMTSASDSKALATAYEKANTELGAMSGKIDTAKGELQELKDKKPGLEEKLKTAQDALKENQTAQAKTKSEIGTKKQTVESLKIELGKQSDGPGAAQAAKNLKEAEAELAALEKQLKELENKETNELKPAEDNAQSAVDANDKAISEKDGEVKTLEKDHKSLDKAVKAGKNKLDKMMNKEKNELRTLSNQLTQLQSDFSKETDSDKKSKISEKYTAKAKEYNGIVAKTNVDGYSAVTADLGS